MGEGPPVGPYKGRPERSHSRRSRSASVARQRTRIVHSMDFAEYSDITLTYRGASLLSLKKCASPGYFDIFEPFRAPRLNADMGPEPGRHYTGSGKARVPFWWAYFYHQNGLAPGWCFSIRLFRWKCPPIRTNGTSRHSA